MKILPALYLDASGRLRLTIYLQCSGIINAPGYCLASGLTNTVSSSAITINANNVTVDLAAGVHGNLKK